MMGNNKVGYEKNKEVCVLFNIKDQASMDQSTVTKIERTVRWCTFLRKIHSTFSSVKMLY